MNGRCATLLTAALGVAAGQASFPDVPWWGELIMTLVAAALAFFGGLANRGR